MPGLRERVVLEVGLDDSSGTTHTGVFEIREDRETAGEITKTFLLSNRGQYLREAFDIADVDNSLGGFENRRGYHVDGGAGVRAERVSGKAGSQDAQWGDGSTDPNDETDISKWDATGADPMAMKQIFEWYVGEALTDSRGQARLHVGEWTDGTYSSEAGVFEKPLAVAVREATATRVHDDPAAVDVSFEAAWTATLPTAELLGDVQAVRDDVADAIPEF